MLKQLSSIVLLFGTGALVAQTTGPQTFSSPEEARDALIQAANKGLDAVKAVFGPDATDIVRTGDAVGDQNVLERFKRDAAERTQLYADPMDSNRITLLIGAAEWPFAVPLIRKDGRWCFDVKEGKAEIRRRVIGGNELDAIQICRGYVEAQEKYAQTDWQGKGVPQYARRIVSTEGKKDGLYWPGDDSPVAAGFAKAMAEGYSVQRGSPKPYHGYFYKILLAQGPDALAGAQDYVVQGLMIGGFALVAWPAEYGVSGIMTFLVNQDGIVYSKDLGPKTGVLAKGMTKFNPDKTWRPEPEEPDDAQ